MQYIVYKIGKGSIWFACVLTATTLIFFLAAFIISSFPVNTGYAQTKTEESIEIFVTSNGVHTDLVLPVSNAYQDWRQKLPLHHYSGVDNSFTYIAFGWGDRRFYMETPEWSDLTFSVALTASLWPTRTAMHVEYIYGRLNPNKRQRPIYLSPSQYQELVRYIESTFQQENGAFIRIPDSGYSDRDNFYEAHGRFYALKNCNHWVNQGLKRTGVKTAAWAPIPYAIMRHLR